MALSGPLLVPPFPSLPTGEDMANEAGVLGESTEAEKQLPSLHNESEQMSRAETSSGMSIFACPATTELEESLEINLFPNWHELTKELN